MGIGSDIDERNKKNVYINLTLNCIIIKWKKEVVFSSQAGCGYNIMVDFHLSSLVFYIVSYIGCKFKYLLSTSHFNTV